MRLNSHPLLHVAFETLGYVFGYQLYRRMRARLGDMLDDDQRWLVIAAAAVGALLGSRTLGLLEQVPRLPLGWRSVFMPGGKTIVGGLLGGWIAVVTVERGVNDDELGAIVDFALQQPCVRGVTFQPVQQAGRLRNFDSETHRLTLTEVRRRILAQTAVFQPEDLIPVPCHPDSLAMGYAMKLAGKVVPLTSLVSPEVLINGGRNTIIYEQDPAIRSDLERNPGLRTQLFKLFSTNHSPQSQATTLRELLCCLPQIVAPRNLGYDNLFRILIVQFIDAQSFDLRSIKKTCIHIAHPDGQRLIPFDTYNLFYRDALEQTRLGPLREAALGYA